MLLQIVWRCSDWITPSVPREVSLHLTCCRLNTLCRSFCQISDCTLAIPLFCLFQPQIKEVNYLWSISHSQPPMSKLQTERPLPHWRKLYCFNQPIPGAYCVRVLFTSLAYSLAMLLLFSSVSTMWPSALFPNICIGKENGNANMHSAESKQNTQSTQSSSKGARAVGNNE